MTYIGNGEGHTLLVLTDAESRLIRQLLELEAELAEGDSERPIPCAALRAFNRGIQRGTERMAAEFKQRAKK